MQDFEYWCRDVLHCVRFHPDHAAIRKELKAHYEDHVADLERIGYPAEEARPKALTAMGAAEEVGRGLDRAHSPALGRLWQASRVTLTTVIIFMLFFITGYRLPEISLDPEPYFEPFTYAVSMPCPRDFEDGVFRYEFEWAEYTYEEARDLTIIHVAAIATTQRFWLRGPDLYDAVTATDSAGRTYRNDYGSVNSVEAFTHSSRYRTPVMFTICVRGELPEWIDVTNTAAGWTFRLEIPQEGGTP